MHVETAGNQQLLKGINRIALIRHLFAHPGVSRADLASAVGLTKSTISLLVRELIDEGWLIEREVVATGDLGRRPTPLFIDPERLLLLGVEVAIDALRIVATSLTGEVRSRVVAPHVPARGAKACINGLAAALVKLHRQLEPSHQRVIGIGVGLPGGVDEGLGVLRFAPNLGWRDVPFGALLGARLAGTPLEAVPLFLQNEADVAALGEREFNPSEAADPLLYLSINDGVGAGVVVGDRLLTGSRGFAGEVGHMVLQLNGPVCSCGRRGCAEAFIGLRAMLPEAGEARAEEPGSAVAEIRAGLARHDMATLRAVEASGRYLGVLLQNLFTAYDPGCIVLGGTVIGLGEYILRPAQQVLEAYAVAAQLEPPVVRVSAFGSDAVAIGAAALARYRLTQPLGAAAQHPAVGAEAA